MKRSSLASPSILGSVMAVVLVAAVQRADQAPAKASAAARAAVPRTAWGAPDLQGIWEGRSNTPLERPNDLAGKEFLTEQEAAELDRQTAETDNLDRREGKIGTTTDVYFGYNQFWREKASSRVRRRRTSLIVDPPE